MLYVFTDKTTYKINVNCINLFCYIIPNQMFLMNFTELYPRVTMFGAKDKGKLTAYSRDNEDILTFCKGASDPP